MSDPLGLRPQGALTPALRLSADGLVIACLCRCDAPACVAQHAALEALLAQGYSLVLEKTS